VRTWYRIQNAAATPNIADLWIYGIIGASFFADDAVTAKQLVDELAALPATVETIRLHLNSPGGDPFDALAIANALRQHPARVEVTIEALSASAASIVAMAGDVVRIHDNALMMIHNPYAVAVGDAAEMRRMAEALEAITGALVTTYQWHTSLDEATIVALMNATTWMDADEAVAKGFATEVVDAVEVAATFPRASLRALGTIPDPYARRIAALITPPPAPARAPEPIAAAPLDILRACEAARLGFLARVLVETQAGPEQLATRIAAAKEIRVICQAAKLDALTEPLVLEGVSLKTVQLLVTTLSARRDDQEIDGALLPNDRGGARPQLRADKIYEARNAPQAARRVVVPTP
jgi:ATP-dependent Clp protease, protease subunit